MSAAAARDLEQALVRLGDDALITAQRLCEWSGRAPTLEEDLALSNVGLDYLGRARLCYAYAGTFSGKTEDDYAFLRSDREYSNLLIVELPRGDFAYAKSITVEPVTTTSPATTGGDGLLTSPGM